MQGRRRILTLFSIALLTGAVGTVGLGSAAADDDGETLTVIFEDRQEQQVDAKHDGPAVFTPGDYYVFAQRLENPRGQTVGNLYGKCTHHFDGMEQCEGAFKLTGKGDISVQTAFPADFSEPVTLAVNGGTGRYQTVHGEGHFAQFSGPDPTPDGPEGPRFGIIFHLFRGDD